MASGQQIAEQNLAAFIAWSVSKSDDDFREYVHRDKLKRSEIAAECGFGKSALVQNPSIKSALEALEERLRGAGVLPPLVADTQLLNEDPPMRDKEAKQRRNDGQRLNALEQENAALRAELAEAKAMLKQYNLLSSFMQETGRLPR
ncbi:MAG: hypothetical protein XD38_0337 [Pseudomonas sp. 63_8]|jgi:hypothetical protein|uniref:VPA1267 family protein n=1 Tax=Pseudomonadaceae TaxID=135621 RepID=UPI0007487A2A|nr:VPA1267 family protein [Stutzerimonas kunmingensis]ELD1891339.1 hypothetical protein [Pseudomonas aeruginosa]KUJ92056.1 MAG: hypothetical protein XD38_0337 [Pseudomonas sp. 63_8]HBO7920461.1 hypothetical protein [Pseudomonas aeruginosa]HCL3406553.1 hypothetical protein [Pseudomonas aeruginosa]HCL3697779.1 hypothetical protein [Pseudomonas aeruginosa]